MKIKHVPPALAARYELTHVVGRGGMAQVWAARDLADGDDVAVKTARVDDDPRRAALLEREAEVTASVPHPGVVGVREVGVDGATAYLVMDLLPGRDLAAILRDGTLPLRDALTLGAQLAETLAATHAAGVVHLDVKPANVVVHDGVATLVDFGIAATQRSPHRVERTTFGTAQYMAPELVVLKEAGPAADLYALGCLLTTAIAGRPPFAGDQPLELLHRHARAVPPRLGELAPGVPAALDELVAALLAKAPADRPSAEQAADALARLARAPHLGQSPGLDELHRVNDPAQRRPVLVRAEGPDAGATDPEAGSGYLDPEATVPLLVALAGADVDADVVTPPQAA